MSKKDLCVKNLLLKHQNIEGKKEIQKEGRHCYLMIKNIRSASGNKSSLEMYLNQSFFGQKRWHATYFSWSISDMCPTPTNELPTTMPRMTFSLLVFLSILANIKQVSVKYFYGVGIFLTSMVTLLPIYIITQWWH